MKKIALSLVLVSFFSLCSCQPKEFGPHGTFYTLEKVLDEKIIDQDDLINIAYYNNRKHFYTYIGGNVSDAYSFYESEPPNGVIRPITPLDSQVALLVNDDYFKILMEEDYFDHLSDEEKVIFLSQNKINVYCGVYNGYYAFALNNLSISGAAHEYEVINDVVFSYPNQGSAQVVLWKMN